MPTVALRAFYLAVVPPHEPTYHPIRTSCFHGDDGKRKASTCASKGEKANVNHAHGGKCCGLTTSTGKLSPMSLLVTVVTLTRVLWVQRGAREDLLSSPHGLFAIWQALILGSGSNGFAFLEQRIRNALCPEKPTLRQSTLQLVCHRRGDVQTSVINTRSKVLAPLTSPKPRKPSPSSNLE